MSIVTGLRGVEAPVEVLSLIRRRLRVFFLTKKLWK